MLQKMPIALFAGLLFNKPRPSSRLRHDNTVYGVTMSSPRHFLIELIKSNKLEQQHTAQAVSLLALKPSLSQWHAFANMLLLVIGSLALVCSVVFFIAYNWLEMGRFVKFGLVQLLILMGLGWYWFTADNHQASNHQANNSDASGATAWLSELALVVSAILLGVLLAVYGQTYQTGADPWQLFFSWTLMILPWALCTRSTLLWLMVIVLANTSVGLYADQALRFAGVWPNIICLSIALFVWEVSARRCPWLNTTWAPTAIAALLCYLFAVAMLTKLFSASGGSLALVAWVIWLITMAITYRTIRPDLLILTFWCLSLIIVITGWVIYVLFEAMFSFDNLLIIALMLVFQGAIASLWLKRCHKELSS